MIVFCVYLLFFFFKQKTAYEMRISDWSSDVCSSDLCQQPSARNAGSKRHLAGDQMRHSHAGDAGHGADRVAVAQVQPDPEQGERPPETDGVDVVDRAARHAQSSAAGHSTSQTAPPLSFRRALCASSTPRQ